MILGYLVIGILFGTISGAISLSLGSSILLALAVYSGVGSLGVLLLAIFHYARSTIVNSSSGRQKKTREANAIEPRWQAR